jgi:hypothetical protein
MNGQPAVRINADGVKSYQVYTVWFNSVATLYPLSRHRLQITVTVLMGRKPSTLTHSLIHIMNVVGRLVAVFKMSVLSASVYTDVYITGYYLRHILSRSWYIPLRHARTHKTGKYISTAQGSYLRALKVVLRSK